MGRNVRVDIKGLEEFQKRFEKVSGSLRGEFIEQCAKELTARLLRKVIKRTPVGVYGGPVDFVTKDGKHVSFVAKANKTGGTLRRAWTTENKNARVIRTGSWVRMEITNSEKYASYVEYGHRTPGGKGWVQGKFMMTISAQEIRTMAPAFLRKKLEAELREAFQ